MPKITIPGAVIALNISQAIALAAALRAWADKAKAVNDVREAAQDHSPPSFVVKTTSKNGWDEALPEYVADLDAEEVFHLLAAQEVQLRQHLMTFGVEAVPNIESGAAS